jgi:hypothetical protein
MFQTNNIQKIKAKLFMFKGFFPNIVPFVSNVEKYDRTIQAANDNMAQAHGMLDN